MKHKGLKITLLSVAGLVVVLVTALQIALNSSYVTETVDKIAAENIDGELRYADLHISLIKSFPRIRVTLDSLSITYPHERFAKYDGRHRKALLVKEGRGEAVDTLVRFDRFTASVNAWHMLLGRIRLSDARLRGLAAYAHQFDEGVANWNLFKTSDEPSDTTSSGLPKLPLISIGEIAIEDHPHVVYTNQKDTVFAKIDFDRFALGANVKLSGGDDISIRKLSLRLDSLSVAGRLPADTLALGMDHLSLSEPQRNVFDLSMNANALVLSAALGRLHVPVSMEGRLKYDHEGEAHSFETPGFDASVAYVPLHLEGGASLYPDHKDISAKATIVECELEKILRLYGDKVTDISKDISTDALLTVELEADGVLSDTSVPHLTACVQMPDANIRYAPMDLKAFLNIDIDADVTPNRYVTADIHEFVARTEGLNIEFDGSAKDLIGRDPLFQVSAAGQMDLESLSRFLPDSIGIEDLAGRLNLDLFAKTRLSELQTYKFENAVVRGSIDGDRLVVSMPADSLSADVFRPEVRVNSNPEGLDVLVQFDSVYFNRGVMLTARAREMRNHAGVSKVDVGGSLVPRLALSTENSDVFLKSGSSRFGLRGMNVSLAAQKRVKSVDDRRRRLLDSLQREYPGTPRNELFRKMMDGNPNRRVPDYMKERDFAKGDITFSLDSSLTRYVREWSPSGAVRAREGFFASPILPLRTRLTAMDMSFDDSDVRVDTLSVISGSSDIALKGYISGLVRSLMHKSMIKMEMDVFSNRFNLNEITAALDAGHSDVGMVSVDEEMDESFVTDEFEDAEFVPLEKLIIVPANVDADLDIFAKNVNYAQFLVDPFEVCIKMKERTLQIVDATASTNVGDILLNAFYSTRSRSDISAGLDLKIGNASAQEVIQLLPAVDSLMPAIKSFEGKFDVDLSATTQLDTNMNVIVPSLDGMMRLSGEDLMVRDAGDLRKITRLLLFKDKNIGKIDNLSVNAIIHDGKIEVFPFELGVDRYRIALRGMQGFDKTMYYHASILRSPFLIRFGINIFGTLDNWRFGLGFPKYRNGKVPQYTQELDAVQLNILRSIQNIYDRGVDNVREFNANNIAAISKKREDTDEGGSMATSLALTAEELAEEGNITMELEMISQESALQEEVDAILKDTYVDAGKLMQDYINDTYSSAAMKRVEKLKKQSERKAAKAAKKAKS